MHYSLNLKNDARSLRPNQECRAGLNFASDREARYFREVVEEKTRHKHEKKQGESASVFCENPPEGSCAHRHSSFALIRRSVAPWYSSILCTETSRCLYRVGRCKVFKIFRDFEVVFEEVIERLCWRRCLISICGRVCCICLNVSGTSSWSMAGLDQRLWDRRLPSFHSAKGDAEGGNCYMTLKWLRASTPVWNKYMYNGWIGNLIQIICVLRYPAVWRRCHEKERRNAAWRKTCLPVTWFLTLWRSFLAYLVGRFVRLLFRLRPLYGAPLLWKIWNRPCHLALDA